MENDKLSAFCRTVSESFSSGRLINVTFSLFPKGEINKVKCTPKVISDALMLQIEYFLTEGRVKHDNVAEDGVSEAVLKLFSLGPRNCQLTAADGSATAMVSSKGAVNTSYKLGKPLKDLFPFISGNDNEKKYIFTGKESFLAELGISDGKGRVHDKKQSKFRQINRFAEQVRDVMKYLPADATLKVYDLCCGKSYLSFALYCYLHEHLGRDVEMVCVDLKKSVIDHCSGIAEKLGYGGMIFRCEDISEMRSDTSPDLVISLHACDTATDVVIDFAIRNKAKVILSTPCCQHEMFRIMDCPDLEFISKYSILKQKIASASTDALRLALLEASGYRTDAIELIDPEETPKNVLLRGVLKRNFSEKDRKEKIEAYKKAYHYMTGKAIEIDRTEEL